MQIIQFNQRPKDLPVSVLFSAEKLIEEVQRYAKMEDHPFHASSIEMLKALERHPMLRTGVKDLSLLDQCEEELNLLFKPLFNDLLQTNEIKAIIMPFTFEGFHPTERFQKILDDAGQNFTMSLSQFDENTLYVYASSVVLSRYYDVHIDFSRPIYIEIPNNTTGKIHHYRALINADFLDVTKTDKASELTKKDIKELIGSADNIELWKEKIPPESYEIKGFSIINLYDATSDVTIGKTRSLFLRTDQWMFLNFQAEIRNMLNTPDLEVGYSAYDTKEMQSLGIFFSSGNNSLVLEENERIDYRELFCEDIHDCAIKNGKMMAIPDLEVYKNKGGSNQLYQRLTKKGFRSIILIPLDIQGRYVQLIELASKISYQLNPLNAKKLEDIIPFIKIGTERYIEDRRNLLESTIQENYTTIHPAVKWRFTEAAFNFNRAKLEGKQDPALEEIQFNNIYPLYGQTDIKNSSVTRNESIKVDLEDQLRLVIHTFEEISKLQPMPIFKNLSFRVSDYFRRVEKGLDAGDELTILEFLRQEIYPVFNHLREQEEDMRKVVDNYIKHIDPKLHVVYHHRKNYDDSISLLNDRMGAFLDQKQAEAQKMFPHYFQSYKTDGIEYNIYIGDELVKDKNFHLVHLQNMRLWQLETMWGLEQVARNSLKDMLLYPMQVASLILVHSHPLSIKFHMDQKAFDVDGAYNARYEIVKKRIDKSHIKGTTERLTQPGKLAIVYSQESDREEYMKYLTYLQSEGMFGMIENVELEDLQGVSGLKALRVEIIYNADFSEELNDIVSKGAKNKSGKLPATLSIK